MLTQFQCLTFALRQFYNTKLCFYDVTLLLPDRVKYAWI